jgi:hypothetical protein
VSKRGQLYLSITLFHPHFKWVNLRESETLVVEVLLLVISLILSKLASNKLVAIVNSFSFDSTATLHSLDDDLSLLFVGVLAFKFFDLIIVLLGSF